MKKFWNWIRDADTGERTLYLCGVIAEESWFDDDITPAMFKADLLSARAISRSGLTLPAATAWPRVRSTTC